MKKTLVFLLLAALLTIFALGVIATKNSTKDDNKHICLWECKESKLEQRTECNADSHENNSLCREIYKNCTGIAKDTLSLNWTYENKAIYLAANRLCREAYKDCNKQVSTQKRECYGEVKEEDFMCKASCTVALNDSDSVDLNETQNNESFINETDVEHNESHVERNETNEGDNETHVDHNETEDEEDGVNSTHHYSKNETEHKGNRENKFCVDQFRKEQKECRELSENCKEQVLEQFREQKKLGNVTSSFLSEQFAICQSNELECKGQAAENKANC